MYIKCTSLRWSPALVARAAWYSLRMGGFDKFFDPCGNLEDDQRVLELSRKLTHPDFRWIFSEEYLRLVGGRALCAPARYRCGFYARAVIPAVARVDAMVLGLPHVAFLKHRVELIQNGASFPESLQVDGREDDSPSRAVS